MSFNRSKKKSSGGYAVVESMMSSYIWRSPIVKIEKHPPSNSNKELPTTSLGNSTLPCFYNEKPDDKQDMTAATGKHKKPRSELKTTSAAFAKRYGNYWTLASSSAQAAAVYRNQPVISSQKGYQGSTIPENRRTKSLVRRFSAYDPRKCYASDMKRKVNTRLPPKSKKLVDCGVSLESKKSTILERQNHHSMYKPKDKEVRTSRESLRGLSLSDQQRTSEIFQCQQVFDPTDYMELQYSDVRSEPLV